MNTDTAGFLDSRDFARIARAIGYIDTHFRAQPRLAAIAAATHLSEFHFNRLFRRWAGITPRQYLAFVTARAARAALGTASVLTAAHAVGLSGPGRLHDLIVSLEAVSPGELKAAGAGVTLRAGLSDTPFGRALIASTARGVTHLEFLEPGREAAALVALKAAWPRAALERDDAAAQRLAARIFGTQPGAARQLRLAIRGTNFQLKVWQALLASGPGATLSYAGLARAAGSGAAARAVGHALAANPVAWLIPCHNVLRRDGTLGGYRYGTERKRAMLVWSALRREPEVPQSMRAGQRA